MIQVNTSDDTIKSPTYPMLAKHLDGEVWLFVEHERGFRIFSPKSTAGLYTMYSINMDGFTPLSKDVCITLRNI